MAQGVVEDGRRLGNVPHPPVEGAAVNAAHLPAVEEDIAGVIRVILEQQLCQRGFAAAAFAHKGHFLGAGNFQCRIPQYGCCRTGVSKARVPASDALDFADGFARFGHFRRGHGGFQPLADAFGGFDFRPALGDLVAGRDDEVCHAGGGGYGAYGQLTAESEEQAHQHHHREDEVADEGGVHHHGVEALLVAQLALSGLPGCVFVAGSVSVLPQKAADDLKAAQQFFQLLGVIGHFQAESIPRRLQPLVHPAGQHQRRDGHQQDRRQHHGADVEVHPQRTQHDAAPEHEVEQRHIVVVVEGTQVGGEQGDVRCVTLGVVLRDGAVQKLLHDAAAHLLHGPAGQFGEAAAAEPLKEPAGEGDGEHKADVAKRFPHGAGVDEPFQLETFQRCEKRYAQREQRKQSRPAPMLLEIIVDGLRLHGRVPPQKALSPV